MNVTKLINLVSLFVFGRNDPTEDDRSTYLNYLNLADYELYRCVKNSKRALQEIELFFEPGLNYAPLPDNYIAEIFSNQIRLDSTEQFYNLESFNKNYYFLNNNIYVNRQNLPVKADPLDNINKPFVRLLVLPLRKELVESVPLPQPNPATQTDTPIYPESYHLGLVHGAIYYLFLSQKGFTEKIQYTLKNWEAVKSDLTSYYMQDK